jgi:two-component system KDP operon response regulator KdpE
LNFANFGVEGSNAFARSRFSKWIREYMIVNEPKNICIVDDDDDFVEFLCQFLNARGLEAKGFGSAEALLKSGDLSAFDFFILDLGLPGIDGVDLIPLIRQHSPAGILVISGRMGADAFNSALTAGADMFVNKPVRFDQVYNAIASVCRRMTMRSDRSASWALDGRRAQFVSPTGSVVDLTGIELMILQRLCADMTTPVSRQDLAEAANLVQSADDRNLDSAIFRLRRKIESVTNQPSPLKTLHGFGYQVTEAVEVVDKPDAV